MTLADKIIVVGIIAISLMSMFIVNTFFYGAVGSNVVIEVNGKSYARYDFNEVTSRKFIEINTQYGYNKVEIDRNKVRIVESSCPDQLCVSAGWIQKTNEMIACLPNRLIVKVAGRDTGIDGVTY